MEFLIITPTAVKCQRKRMERQVEVDFSIKHAQFVTNCDIIRPQAALTEAAAYGQQFSMAKESLKWTRNFPNVATTLLTACVHCSRCWLACLRKQSVEEEEKILTVPSCGASEWAFVMASCAMTLPSRHRHHRSRMDWWTPLLLAT